MKLRRDFAEEGQLSLVEAIEEVPVTAIALVKRPGFHGNSVVDGLVDQLQSDLALGEKFDVLGDMRFFSACGIISPFFGLVHSCRNETLKCAGGKRCRNTDHRVFDFPPVAVALAFDADGVASALGSSRFVNHADRLGVAMLGRDELTA
tara:strand:- start:210 stop:656 length:447 start_codon:yes stop_codon:yes gene_type:complete